MKMKTNNTQNHASRESIPKSIPAIIGAGIIVIAGLILIETAVKTGWLLAVGMFISGLLLLIGGIWLKKALLLFSGCIFTSFGIGLLIQAAGINLFETQTLIGLLLASFGFGCLLMFFFSRVVLGSTAWWALIPAFLIGSTAFVFLFTTGTPFEFILYILSALGVSLLMWGVARRLFGLIIPGCLLLGIGPGIYFAWGNANPANPLVQTGLMLVWFALGFALISLFSRTLKHIFIWWPFIPGGVLAMVGWGLYLGGDPDNAVSFISNTGSIALIIFGLYLILLRRGLHR